MEKPIVFIIDACAVQAEGNMVSAVQTKKKSLINDACKRVLTRIACIRGLEQYGEVVSIPQVGNELRRTANRFRQEREHYDTKKGKEFEKNFYEFLNWLDKRLVSWKNQKGYSLLMGHQFFEAAKSHNESKKEKYGDFQETDRHLIATAGALGQQQPCLVCTRDDKLKKSLESIIFPTIRELQAQEIMRFPIGRYTFGPQQETYRPERVHYCYLPKQKSAQCQSR
jgi:hypothetical protein